jgi:hypothetical protein
LHVGILSASRGPNLRDNPLWALNADYDFYRRKLEIVRERRKRGEPAHKKYPNYESSLKEILSLLEGEIERRKEKGS